MQEITTIQMWVQMFDRRKKIDNYEVLFSFLKSIDSAESRQSFMDLRQIPSELGYTYAKLDGNSNRWLFHSFTPIHK